MEAYDIEKIPSYKRLGATVECIAAYDDTLLVAVKEGHLLQTKTTYDADISRYKFESKTFSSFSSKPVSELYPIPECSLLISVSESVLSVHDLVTLELKFVMKETKGASIFTVNAQEIGDEQTDQQVDMKLQLCVAVARKLQLYHWENDQFVQTQEHLLLVKTPKTLLWCKNVIFVGFKDEYFMIKPLTGMSKELFTLGSQKEPNITKIDEDNIILSYDNKSVFVNTHGHPVKDFSVEWSSQPLQIVCDPPYLLAVLNKHVEVRSIDPTVLIQNIELKHVNTICQASRGLAFLQKSKGEIYLLKPRPVAERIQTYQDLHHYDLAIQLATLSDMDAASKHQLTSRIQTRQAVHQFCSRQYVEAMELFLQGNTDPSHVTWMFPKLYTQLQQAPLYPEKIPALDGGDLENAVIALREYLEKMREAVRGKDELAPFIPVMDHPRNVVLNSRDDIYQVIDTALLQCYLQTNEGLIAPLLRRPDNCVVTEVAEKALQGKQKFLELVILYEHRGMHTQALVLLKEQARRTDMPLSGPGRTIQYLQRLGKDHLGLIYTYSTWVLHVHPADGLQIFIEETSTVMELPRGHILSFIEQTAKGMAIPYLEHVIYEWNDMTEELHYSLAMLLVTKVEELYQAFVKTKSKGYVHRVHHKAGTEPGELGVYRSKLVHFLATSQHYRAEDVLTRFPLDKFFEERAILLGRLKRHGQVLGIYLIILDDAKLAEEYCAKHYNSKSEEDKDVYLELLNVYLDPPEPSTLGLPAYRTEPRPDVDMALRLLEEHAIKIDPTKALGLLPEDIPVVKLRQYIETHLQARVSRRYTNQIRRRLQMAEYIQMAMEKAVFNRKKVFISEDRKCFECNKRIGKSYFARYPNDVVVHYGCMKNGSRSPTEPSMEKLAESLKIVHDDDVQY